MAGEELKAFEVKAGEVLTLTAHVSDDRDALLGWNFTLEH